MITVKELKLYLETLPENTIVALSSECDSIFWCTKMTLTGKYLSEDKNFILDEDEVPKNAVKFPVLVLEYV